MDIDNLLNLFGLGCNLIGFILLVNEVRWAQKIEFQNIYLNGFDRSQDEFQRNPRTFTIRALMVIGATRKGANEATRNIPEVWDEANADQLRDFFSRAIARIDIWEEHSAEAALKRRKKLLFLGAVLICLGLVLQAVGVFAA